MTRNKKIVISIATGTIALAMVAGAAGFYVFSTARAEETLIGSEQRSALRLESIGDQLEAFADDSTDFGHRGKGRNPGMDGLGFEKSGDGAYLAEALGITAEELTAAKQAAWEKGLAQAVSDGLITQKQADWLKDRPMGIAGRGLKLFPWMGEAEVNIDLDALLATEFGISTDELTAAREKASELSLQAAIDDGSLTQEQADWIKVRRALQPYIDRQALSATALGLTVDEMTTARQDGKDMETLLEEQGLTAEEFQTALQAAYQAALQKALDDGVITQEQMDTLLSQQTDGFRMMPGFPGMPGMDDFGRGQRGGGRAAPNQLPDDSSVTPESDL